MSPPRQPAPAGELQVIGEYRGLLFVDKPAGLQTEPDARHADTLVTRLAAQLGLPAAEIHALSRLDTGVSGVVTLGLTHEARRLVTNWRTLGQFRRRYLALASGNASAPSGEWTESIGRASGNLRRAAGQRAELARTSYALIASSPLFARASPRQVQLLALSPRTGRTHQLRVHAAAHGLPLLGDRAYGGASRLTAETGSVRSLDRIALHAAWVELPLAEPLRFEAAVPRELLQIWGDFAGDEVDFGRAAQAPLAD
ncbi:MAG TPA: pseudouridine synthase [Polyangiaceae bacterium]|jgi:23S rRNA pseudouridine1911/1915/1917 synthase|nr:pseudouridine synthase [Polyangiaceae bacterium]